MSFFAKSRPKPNQDQAKAIEATLQNGCPDGAQFTFFGHPFWSVLPLSLDRSPPPKIDPERATGAPGATSVRPMAEPKEDKPACKNLDFLP